MNSKVILSILLYKYTCFKKQMLMLYIYIYSFVTYLTS